MCELALTKAQSEKRKVKSESAKRKRVLTPLLWKGYKNILSNNFRKLKLNVVIFAKQGQRSKEKLTVQRKSTSTN